MRKLTFALTLIMSLALTPAWAFAQERIQEWDDGEGPDVEWVVRQESRPAAHKHKPSPFRGVLGYGVTAVAAAAIVFGLWKTYFIWKGWQVQSQRKLEPWEVPPP